MENIVAVFTILSSISTAIYAIIAFRTLTEIRAQRETTYQPDIITEDKSFFLYYFKNNGSKFPVEFSYDRKDLTYETKRPVVNSFGINLYNIGLGSAKQIQIKYSIDLNALNKVIDEISELSKGLPQDKIFKLIIKERKLTVHPPELSNRGLSVFVMDNEEKVDINHLLPVNISSSPYQLPIPVYLLDIYSISIYTSWLSNGSDISELPPVRISIEYRDIGNKIHKKEYWANIKYYSGSIHHIIGHLAIKESSSANHV